jgi:hypothetical protein
VHIHRSDVLITKDPNLIAKEGDSKLPSDEKDVVHDLQDQAIIEDDKLVKIPEVIGGKWIFLHQTKNLLQPLC